MGSLTAQIVGILKQNARTSVSDIARLTAHSESEVAQRISDLEKSGAIVNYTAILNDEKLDMALPLRALVEVKVHPQKKSGFDAIAKQICHHREVVDHYLLSGGYDFLIVIEGKTLQEISWFVADKLASIDHVTGTTTHFIMKKYKENGVEIIDTESPDRLAVSP